MRFTTAPLFASLLALTSVASAEPMLTSTSLSTCQDSSKFSASLFDVAFTPQNNTLNFRVNGFSSITGNVNITLKIIAYGLSVYTTVINPCEKQYNGLCPMNQGPIDVESNTPVDQESISKIPGIAYTVPDLDARVQVYFNDSTTGISLACVEAELSNGKTVDQRGVAWVVAVISGLALVASAITSGLGHSNTAAHVAANALSLFSYFQAQAFIGMSAVPLPPIVSAWTQNFQWSMGIINVGFLQDVAMWYQRSTGGTPSLIISNLDNVSVEVQKRSLESVGQIVQRSVSHLVSRATNTGVTPRLL